MGSSLRYSAPPVIGAFMRCDKFIRGLMGPFGSGKSTAAVVELVRRSMQQEPDANRVRRTRWAIIRNTYPELRDTTRKTFEEWVPHADGSEGWLEQEFSFTLTIPMPDGTKVEAEFLFRALDRPEHVKKLLSLELTGAWINEAREVPFTVVKMLMGRVGRFPRKLDGGPTWFGIIMDTNPPDDDSWWYKLFEEQKPGNAEIFKQPGGYDEGAENLENLPKGYYDNLVMANPDPNWIKVHVHAQYGPTITGKPIYPEYKDNVHTVEPIKVPVLPVEFPLLLGVDFGLTPAAMIGQRDPRDQQIQWIDELVAEDLGAVHFFEDLARYLKTAYPGKAIKGTGDPGGDIRSQVDERTPYDIAHAQGIPLVKAHTNDPELRREAVARPLSRLTLLGRPGLVVSTKCRIGRKAMNGAYCYKRVAVAGEDRFKLEPDKNQFSHIAEAGQYLNLGEGEDSAALTSDSQSSKPKFKVKMAGARRHYRRA